MANKEIAINKELKSFLETRTITYYSAAEGDELIAIAGEFNQWVPQNMTRDSETGKGFFKVDVQLVKGYSYRFCFFKRPDDENPIVD